MLQDGTDPTEAMNRLGVTSVTDDQIREWIQEVFSQKSDLVNDLKAGNFKSI
jgi:Asp-tRNA(Asn)/Glu-tRNA(Gln) amidotransferase B subunit